MLANTDLQKGAASHRLPSDDSDLALQSELLHGGSELLDDFRVEAKGDLLGVGARRSDGLRFLDRLDGKLEGGTLAGAVVGDGNFVSLDHLVGQVGVRSANAVTGGSILADDGRVKGANRLRGSDEAPCSDAREERAGCHFVSEFGCQVKLKS